MDMSFILSKLLMMFAAIGASFVAVKKGLWGKEGNQVFSNAVTYVLNPATILASTMTGERPLSNSQVLILVAIAFSCYAFLIGSSFLIPKLLKVPVDKKRIYRFMYIFSNVGFFGLPVVRALFGSSAAFLVVIYILPFQALTFTYGVMLMAKGQEGAKLSYKTFLHPMILSCVAALILYLCKVQAPAIIFEPLNFLGGATSPLAMMVVGGSLAFTPLKSVFTNWRLYALTLIKSFIVPVMVLFILKAILPHTESYRLMIGVSAIIMAMPVAAVSTILANQYNQDVTIPAAGVCLSTLFSVVSIPFVMWLLNTVL